MNGSYNNIEKPIERKIKQWKTYMTRICEEIYIYIYIYTYSDNLFKSINEDHNFNMRSNYRNIS